MTEIPENPNPPTESRRGIPDQGHWTHSAFFREYAPRLEALIRGRLAPRFRSRFDADDVVQSAFRSFFLRPAPPSSVLSKETDLWPLLAEIAVRKLVQQIRRHQAQRRDVRNDRYAEEPPSVSGTRPDDSASLAEIIETVQTRLDGPAAAAFQLRIQGYEILEIAEQLQISERTARRQLAVAKELLQRLLNPEPSLPVVDATGVPTRDSSDFATLHFDDYRLHQLIGDGASGKVYRATERGTDRVVAVKFLKKEFLFQPRFVDSFLREVEIVSRLQHPGIVSVFGLGKTPNHSFFLVMEWATGGDLTRYTAGDRPALSQIAVWIGELAKALKYAHQHGIFHCDLKPGNVLIGSHGQLLLSDFGLARRALHWSDPRSAMGGTPAFIAPEMVNGAEDAVGPHTDVFGVGGILFNLLTGRPPYHGISVKDVLRQAASDEPVVWPPHAATFATPEWRAFCDQMLAKDVSERLPDMAAVERELRMLNARN